MYQLEINKNVNPFSFKYRQTLEIFLIAIGVIPEVGSSSKIINGFPISDNAHLSCDCFSFEIFLLILFSYFFKSRKYNFSVY